MKRKYSTVLAALTVIGWFVSAQAQAQTLTLDPASSIVRFQGTSGRHGFEGQTRDMRSSLEVDLKEQKLLSAADLSIPIEGFKTGNDARDHAMQHMFEMKRYPEILFHVAVIAPAEEKGTYDLEGTVSIHGVTQPVRIKAQAVITEETVRVKGEYRMNVEDFGMKPPSMLGVFRVRKDVLVSFDTTWIVS